MNILQKSSLQLIWLKLAIIININARKSEHTHLWTHKSLDENLARKSWQSLSLRAILPLATPWVHASQHLMHFSPLNNVIFFWKKITLFNGEKCIRCWEAWAQGVANGKIARRDRLCQDFLARFSSKLSCVQRCVCSKKYIFNGKFFSELFHEERTRTLILCCILQCLL